MDSIINLMVILSFSLILMSCNDNKQDQKGDIAPKLMWIDATANIQRFNNKDTIDYYIEKLGLIGFTDVIVDIRPVSGHVLYDSNIAPKLTEWNGKKIDYKFDYLEYFIKKAHKSGLKVHASLNTFVAGHNYVDAGPIYEEGKSDWSTIVYPPEEDVRFIPITDQKHKYSAMVNPVNEEFQDYILSIFQEVVMKYPKLDGIILDRVRYDGFTSDFSILSKKKFETYLGVELDLFPDDIYRWKYDRNGNLYPERGKYFMEWVEWRASVIYEFMKEAREAVKTINPKISFGTYTGAWYPTYFEFGVNFASNKYDPFGRYDWATSNYKEYGYAELLDLFTVGNYYTKIRLNSNPTNNHENIPEINPDNINWEQPESWYYVEGSNLHLKTVLNNNKFYGGILASLFYDNPEDLTESIIVNCETSDGLMIFDISHIIDKDMWEYVKKGMKYFN